MTLSISDLPDALFLMILSEWVTLKDVSTVDTAVCVTKNRRWFLELLRTFKQTEKENNSSPGFYSWVSRRSLKLKYFIFSQKSLSKWKWRRQLLWERSLCTNHVEHVVFDALQPRPLDNFQRPLIPIKRLPGDDSKVVAIVNSCPNLKVLEISLSVNYFTDSTTLKFTPSLLAKLIELTIEDHRQVTYPKTVAAITTHCRILRKLVLKLESNDADITEIVKLNPDLVDISVSLGGALDGVSIISFLQFLMDSPNKIRRLDLLNYLLASENFQPIIDLFFVPFFGKFGEFASDRGTEVFSENLSKWRI